MTYVETVPVQGPYMSGLRPITSWTTGLCDCGAAGKCDCVTCATSTFCPWSILGANAKMMQTNRSVDPCDGWCTKECGISGGLYWGGQIVGCILGCCLDAYAAYAVGGIGYVSMVVYSQTLRNKTRVRNGIEQGECVDCCAHFWCLPCAVAQEHYEIKVRLPRAVIVAPTLYMRPAHQVMHAPSTFDAQPHHRSRSEDAKEKNEKEENDAGAPPAEDQSTQGVRPKKFCTNCGSKLITGGKFCTECGTGQ